MTDNGSDSDEIQRIGDVSSGDIMGQLGRDDNDTLQKDHFKNTNKDKNQSQNQEVSFILPPRDRLDS